MNFLITPFYWIYNLFTNKTYEDFNDFLNTHGDSIMIGGFSAFIEQCFFVNNSEAHGLFLSALRAIIVGATGYCVVEILKHIKSKFTNEK